MLLALIFQLVLVLVIPFVSAHARLAYPIPLGAPSTSPSGNDYNAPLHGDGSDFPCKGLHKTASLTPTATWNAGEGTHFEILGGGDINLLAAHSGGSCQASISFDGGNTWRVLHSWHGGCPRGGVRGSNDSAKDQRFDFGIPSEAKAGSALFAWTWIPATGNRDEFYMSCASVNIKGRGTSALENFPDMYLGQLVIPGHIRQGECYNNEFEEPVYPFPGDAVDTQNPVPSGLVLKAPSGGNCIAPSAGKSSLTREENQTAAIREDNWIPTVVVRTGVGIVAI